MKKLLKLATLVVALSMIASAAAEAQGGGGGGGGGGAARGGGGGGQGRAGGGRGGIAGRITAEGVSADSAYALMMTGITLEPAKKTAVMGLITKLQADLKANPAPARVGGGAAGGGAAMDSTAMAAMQAATAKRNGFITAFRTEAKKSLTAEQSTQFDLNVPDPSLQGRRGGGGGGSPSI